MEHLLNKLRTLKEFHSIEITPITNDNKIKWLITIYAHGTTERILNYNLSVIASEIKSGYGIKQQWLTSSFPAKLIAYVE